MSRSWLYGRTPGLSLRVKIGISKQARGRVPLFRLLLKKGGYAITDRGTFLAYQANVDLEILVESDPFLLNVYHVITVNPEKWPNVNLEGAKAFANFVTSPEGQKLIGEFGMDKYGQQLFIPDADKTDEELGLP